MLIALAHNVKYVLNRKLKTDLYTFLTSIYTHTHDTRKVLGNISLYHHTLELVFRGITWRKHLMSACWLCYNVQRHTTISLPLTFHVSKQIVGYQTTLHLLASSHGWSFYLWFDILVCRFAWLFRMSVSFIADPHVVVVQGNNQYTFELIILV